MQFTIGLIFVGSVATATARLDYSLAGFAVCLILSTPGLEFTLRRNWLALAAVGLLMAWLAILAKHWGQAGFRDLLGLLIIGLSAFCVVHNLSPVVLRPVLIASGLVILLAGMLQIVGISSGTLILVPNDVSACLLLIPVVMSVVLSSRQGVFWIIVATVGCALALLAGSRLAALTAMAMAVTGYLHGQPRMPRLSHSQLGSLVLVTLGLIVAILVAKPPESLQDRWLIWQATLDSGWRAMLVGHDFGDFGAFLERSPYRDLMTDRRIIPWPHNLWLESLWTGGVFLLLLHLGTVVLGVRKAVFKPCSQILAMSAGWILVQTFEASWIRWWTWFFFGIWLGLLLRSNNITPVFHRDTHNARSPTGESQN